MNYYSNPPQAQGFTPRQTNAAFNQDMADAHAQADPRYNMKPMDRAGWSRGASQNAMAGISSAQRLAEGVARAYSGRLEDAQANASTDLGNAQAQEQLGLSLAGIDQQQRYQQALAALQRQQDAQQFNQGILGGLLGGAGGQNWLNGFLGF